jgi:hypothetical protein
MEHADGQELMRTRDVPARRRREPGYLLSSFSNGIKRLRCDPG